MKKIILAVLIVLTVCSCACNNTVAQEEEYERFEKIYIDSNYYVVYDIETKVQYAVSRGYYNRGCFTLLVNAEGKPLLYEE